MSATLILYRQRRLRAVSSWKGGRVVQVNFFIIPVLFFILPTVNRQAYVARRITALITVVGHPSNTLVRRPFFVFWLMSQVSR
jgi:hypothetical protein